MKLFFESFNSCLKTKSTTYSIIDKILLRSRETKLSNYCHYQCSLNNNINYIKINGRYPFREILYCTEFFASIFSIFNLLVHFYFFNRKIAKQLKFNKLGQLYKIQYQIFCMCWISSALFHINDILITRYMDYFFAFLFLIFALYLNIYRTILLLNIKNTFLMDRLKYSLIFYYIFHVFYMILIDFNYDYSKTSCAVLFVVNNILWFIQYVKSRQYPHAKYILIYSILLIIGALIEIYDLPPLFYLIDSHAIWHLITALIAPFYYFYLEKDMIHKRNIDKINK